MSLNNGYDPKQQQRQQLQQAVEAYEQNGGTVNRQRDRMVAVACHVCSYRAYGSIAYATTWGKGCPRCGARTRVQF
jgi:hypothetical protein